MSVTISQTYRPTNNAWYAKNTVPRLLIETTENVGVTVYYKNQTAQSWEPEDIAFKGSYAPDFLYEVWVDLEGIYDSFVKTKMPTESQTELVQDKAWYYFRAVVTDSNGTQVGTAITWQVVNARLNSATPFQQWSQLNFLTNQPIEKPTNYDAKEWLTYLDLDGDWNVIGRFYPKEGGNVDCIVRSDTGTGCFSVDVSYARLIPMVARLPHQLKGYYDIILTDGKLEEICRQRYLYEERSGREKHFLIVNALGGIDTLICNGENVLQPEVTHNIGRFGKQYRALDDTDDTRRWVQQTGGVPYRWRDWIHELTASKQDAAKYNPENNTLTPIVIVESEVSMSDNGQLAGATFTYMTTEVGSVMADTERAVDRTLHQSAADQVAELDGFALKTVLAFAANGQSGYSTEEADIPAAKLYVEFAKTATSGTVTYSIDGKEVDSFDPSTDSSPVVINKGINDSIQFESATALLAAVTVSYYPVTVQIV